MTNKINKVIKVMNRVMASMGFVSMMVALMAVPAVSYAALLYRQLDFGMTGADVTDLQTFLAQDPTIYPQGLITGYFGSLTRAAVSSFQARNGISVVGRVGPITLAAINAQMGGLGGDVNAPIINPVSVSTSRNTATVKWSTNENASAKVFYSTSPISLVEKTSRYGNVGISGSSFLVNSNLQTSHTANLSDLDSGTKYYYVAYVKDAAGNESLTWPETFNTSN